jgi:hypothetical protein
MGPRPGGGAVDSVVVGRSAGRRVGRVCFVSWGKWATDGGVSGSGLWAGRSAGCMRLRGLVVIEAGPSWVELGRGDGESGCVG